MDFRIIAIFVLLSSLILAWTIGTAVKSFQRFEYFLGGLYSVAAFWTALVMAMTFFKLLL